MKTEMKKALVAAILVLAAVLSTAAGGIGMSNAKSSSAKKLSSYEDVLYEIESARCIAEEMGLSDVKVGESPSETPAATQSSAVDMPDLYGDNPEIKAAMEQYVQVDAEEYVADFEESLGKQLDLEDRDKLVAAIEQYNNLCKNKLMNITTEYVNSDEVANAKQKLDTTAGILNEAQRKYNEACANAEAAKTAYDAATANTSAAQANYDNLSGQTSSSASELAALEGAYQTALSNMESAKAAYDITNGKLAAYQNAVATYNWANARRIAAIVSGDSEAQAEAQAQMDAAEAAQKEALSGYYFEGALELANNANKALYERAEADYQTVAADYNAIKAKVESENAVIESARVELENAKSSESAAKDAAEKANAAANSAQAELTAADSAYRDAQNWYNVANSSTTNKTESKQVVSDEEIAEAEYMITKIKTDIVNGSSADNIEENEENDILSALLDGKSNSEREQLDFTINSLLEEPTIKALSGSKATYSDVCKSASDYIKTRIEKVNDERQNANTVSIALIACAVIEFIAAGIALLSKKNIGTVILAGAAGLLAVVGTVMCALKNVSNTFAAVAFVLSCVICIGSVVLCVLKSEVPNTGSVVKSE